MWNHPGTRREESNKMSVSHVHATRQEKELADKLGGHPTKGSGSGNEKGDVRVRGKYRIECKCTKNKSFSLKREILDKIGEEALNAGELPILQLDFINDTGKKLSGFYIIPEEFVDL